MIKKKILFYTSGIGLGGVEKVLLELLKSMDKNKFDIKVAFQNADENYFENEIPKEVNYKFMLSKDIIEKTLFFKERKSNIFYKICYLIMMKYEKYIIKKNFISFSDDRDIIIDFKSGDFYKIIQLNKKAKKICWIHTEITKLIRFEKRKKRLKKFFKRCDKIVCICNEMKDNFIKEIPEVKDKIEVIYNCFDIEKIKKLSEQVQDLSLKEQELINKDYIIMVGRLDNNQKDFTTLIKAFKIYKEKSENKIFLYLLGDGPDREEIENLIIENNLSNKVLILGAKKNPYPWIKNSKILVHSSKFEGFALVLIEAAILNKLIISSNCPVGPTEILDYGKSGILFDTGNVKMLSQKLEENLLNEKLGQIYIENMNKRIEKFSKEKLIKKCENLIKKV